MKHSDFIHLHVHSQYSLLDGACLLPSLVESAEMMKMPALTITDHGNIFGAIEFYEEATNKGIKPIIGCEVYVAQNSRLNKGESGSKEHSYHFTLLIKNAAGYKNLVKLVSIGYLEGFYYKPRIDKEMLVKHSEGLIGLSGCLKGEISSLILAGKEKDAAILAGQYRDIFEKGSFFLEVMDHGLPEQKKANKSIVKLSKELNIPIVATNDVHYLKKEMAHAHEVLLSLQTQTTLSDDNRMRLKTDEFYFKSPEEMKQLFSEIPESLSNTLSISEMCNLKLDFKQTHLPHYSLPEGIRSEDVLRETCLKNIHLRYPGNTEDALKRLNYELTVIKNAGFASYFLIVSDFVNFAKKNKISVGPGRGSAAGSIVSYLTGITEVDPLKYDLLFERFLNPERVSLPDIDIDFCYERRDEVIKYVIEKYGKDNVAQIITFGTMAAKGVLRDVGRVMGLPYADVDKIAKLIPLDPNISLAQAIDIEPELKQLYKSDVTIKELIDTAYVLEGLTRHASTHAAGVVISDKPLCEYIPLFKSENQITTGYTMKSLEKIGLLKMDFLGLKTLTMINETIKIIKRTSGIDFDINQIPLEDEKAYSLLAKAETIGVFQLESSGMRDLLKKLKPEKFEDIIALLALYRPGPLGSGMVEDFIKRKRSGEKVNYDHPLLEPILKDTYGIILYQEQAMRITNLLAGFSLSQADLLRRAMSKKIPEVIEKLKNSFVEGAAKKGISQKTSEKIFGLIEFFAGYGFNKSHSTAYALISYQTAYLKANYPVEFMAALLGSERDNSDKIATYIAESKHMGINILPPDINESFALFTVIEKKSIRFGLSAVKNVGQNAVDAIIASRKEAGAFKTLFDFCERVDSRTVNKKVIESLIKCGSFDSLGIFRAQLMASQEKAMNLGNAVQKDKNNGQLLLFDSIGQKFTNDEISVKIEEWPENQLLSFEKEMLGFYISKHPIDQYEELLNDFSILKVSELLKKDLTPAEVHVAGAQEKVKITFTKKSAEKMAILRLEDRENSIDVLVYPQTYKQNCNHIRQDAVVVVKGRLDLKEDVPKIIASEIIPIENISDVLTQSLSLNISSCDEGDKIFPQLKQIMLSHPGKTPVHLSIASEKGKKIKIQAQTRVQVDNLLISQLRTILNKTDISINTNINNRNISTKFKKTLRGE